MTYFTVSELRARGWNARLVRQFLGEPDSSHVPPGPRPGRACNLYLQYRVLFIEERNPQFAHEKSRKEQLAQRAALARHNFSAILTEEVDGVVLPALPLPLETVIALAKEKNPTGIPTLPENRLALDYLLDTLKPLEAALEVHAWRPGIRAARQQLQQKLLAHIVKQYPALAGAASQERAA